MNLQLARANIQRRLHQREDEEDDDEQYSDDSDENHGRSDIIFVVIAATVWRRPCRDATLTCCAPPHFASMASFIMEVPDKKGFT